MFRRFADADAVEPYNKANYVKCVVRVRVHTPASTQADLTLSSVIKQDTTCSYSREIGRLPPGGGVRCRAEVQQAACAAGDRLVAMS